MNSIPPMIHELGQYWKQPETGQVLIDDTHALLTEAEFNMLADYSASMPSGVYDGKMWKCLDREALGWLLCWYGPSTKPDHCSVNTRKIILL